MLLALNLGSGTLKAAFYPRGHDAHAGPTPHRTQFDFDPEAFDARRTLLRITASHPSTFVPTMVVHRIVHGGRRTQSAILTEELQEELLLLAPLAPLHQAAALQLVGASQRAWPDAVNVGVFDTAWHATLAPWSRRLPLPTTLHDAGVMRYGFHGIAFQSSMRQLRAFDPVGRVPGRVVLAHLGSGCSLCAVLDGNSTDTTMGFTPLDGLPMATRSGSLDPGIVLHLARQMAMPAATIEQTLWRESGLLGISGLSGDMRRLLVAHDVHSQLAVEQFVMRVAQAIAGMATALGGIDALVFSGGIGSHMPVIRTKVIDNLHWMGLRLDPALNESGGPRIDSTQSCARIWSILVDEELEMAEAGAALGEC